MAGPIPSLGLKRDSAAEKIARADEHLGALKQSLQQFSNRDPYAIAVRKYDSPLLVRTASRHITYTSPSGLLLPRPQTRYLTRWTAAIVTLTLRPGAGAPVLHWGTIIGDIVHNLASALDNLVWELSQVNPHASPRPSNAKGGRNWDRLQRAIAFPYCKDSKDWPSACDHYLPFVDPALYTIFEEAQPFYAQQHHGEDPEHHSFWVLHELWNRDKHRTVNLTTAAAEYMNTALRIPGLFPNDPELRTETLETFPMRPIEGETQLAVIRVHFPGEVEVGTEVEMHMNPKFTLAILLGQDAPAAGDDVLDKLWDARHKAATLLNKFA